MSTEFSTTTRKRDRMLFGAGVSLILLAAATSALAQFTAPPVTVPIQLACVVACFGLFGWCLGLEPARKRLIPFALIPAVAALVVLFTSTGGPVDLRVVGLMFGLPYALGFLSHRLSPSGAAYATAAVGLATFAATAPPGGFFLLLAVVFPACVWFTLLRNPPPNSARVLCAVTFGFAATWLGVAWNIERFDRSGHGAHYDAHAVWLAEHGASREHFPTDIVTGFPIQAIEGHSGGGAPTRVLPGKGLGALVANHFLWVAALFAVAFALPRKALLSLTWAGVGLAFWSGWQGSWTLFRILD